MSKELKKGMRVILHAKRHEDADLEGKHGFIEEIYSNYVLVTRSSAPYRVYWDRRLITPYEPPEPSDSDLRISVAKLREVLKQCGYSDGDVYQVNYPLDEIIEKVKSEL
ncbi:MAG: hypothetical protein Q4F07_07610 [Bacteroidales bacterium]|nr:hypothetical protein [Bacteroidales bacterium]